MHDKKQYDMNYMKENCRQIKLLLHKDKDKDIIDFLDSLPNRNGYLKELLRKEIKKK